MQGATENLFRTQHVSCNLKFGSDETKARGLLENICSITYRDNQAVGK